MRITDTTSIVNEINEMSSSNSFRMEKIEPLPVNVFHTAATIPTATQTCYVSSTTYPTMRSSPNTVPIESYETTVANDGTDADSYYVDNVLRGRQAQKLGHLNDAITYYQNAIFVKKHTILSESKTVQKDYANILFHLGSIYLQQYTETDSTDKRCLHSAAVVFEKCLEIRNICYPTFNETDGSWIPQHIEVSVTMYYLAHVHLKLNTEYQYSISLLNEALSILLIGYPNHVNCIITIWQELSRAQYAMGDLDDAESSLNEIRLIKNRMRMMQP